MIGVTLPWATILAPWSGEGLGLHTPGSGLEPRTQMGHPRCPELPVSPTSTEIREESKQTGPRKSCPEYTDQRDGDGLHNHLPGGGTRCASTEL